MHKVPGAQEPDDTKLDFKCTSGRVEEWVIESKNKWDFMRLKTGTEKP